MYINVKCMTSSAACLCCPSVPNAERCFRESVFPHQRWRHVRHLQEHAAEEWRGVALQPPVSLHVCVSVHLHGAQSVHHAHHRHVRHHQGERGEKHTRHTRSCAGMTVFYWNLFEIRSEFIELAGLWSVATLKDFWSCKWKYVSLSTSKCHD